MKPTVRRLEEEFKGKVDFQAMNIDSASSADAKTQYKFRAQPQFVVVGPKGDVVASRNGSQSYETLKKDIETALAMR